MGDVYIVGAVRTPIARGYQNGAYHGVLHPVELLKLTLEELMKRVPEISKDKVEDVIGGVVSPVAEQGGNLPRFAVLAAGFPETVTGVQINRMCGSGQQAIHFASQAIASGDMDIVIACGVEMMSTVKIGADLIGNDFKKLQNIVGDKYKLLHQGQSAELIAEKYNISKEDMTALSIESHRRAHLANSSNKLLDETFSIQLPNKDSKSNLPIPNSFFTFSQDQGIRHPSNPAKLASLPTPFKPNGRITAAHASQISDGAAALLLVSSRVLSQYRVTPLAKVLARVVIGSSPELMLTGPIEATRQVLKKAGLELNEIDVFEINEAFASVVEAWRKELGVDMEKVNVNGGAMATGHPLGGTGAILATKLVYELKRSGKRYGLQTMCIGYGQATATIYENCNPKKNGNNNNNKNNNAAKL